MLTYAISPCPMNILLAFAPNSTFRQNGSNDARPAVDTPTPTPTGTTRPRAHPRLHAVPANESGTQSPDSRTRVAEFMKKQVENDLAALNTGNLPADRTAAINGQPDFDSKVNKAREYWSLSEQQVERLQLLKSTAVIPTTHADVGLQHYESLELGGPDVREAPTATTIEFSKKYFGISLSANPTKPELEDLRDNCRQFDEYIAIRLKQQLAESQAILDSVPSPVMSALHEMRKQMVADLRGLRASQTSTDSASDVPPQNRVRRSLMTVAHRV